MNISEVIPTMRAEILLEKTPCGRPITNNAIGALKAAMSDEKNYSSPATLCLNCCIIGSSLLIPEGCVNCGGKDLTTNITKNDIL